MIQHIDVSRVLRHAVCDLYSNLVTRPTGAAVRTQIERLLSEAHERSVTVIDFTHVGLLDFSCADEVVAKLLLRYHADPAEDAFFVFRGVRDEHLEAIEQVLGRYGLALVLQLDDGAVQLVGEVPERERRAWEAICRRGSASAEELAAELATAPDEAASVLEGMYERRLLMRLAGRYVPVGAGEGA